MTDNEKDAARVGQALAEGRIRNPYKAWKLPTVRDEHGNLNPHLRNFTTDGKIEA